MKRSNMYLPMAALILAAAAVPATAQQQVPFKGTFQGNDLVVAPTITQTITGNGTHVGQFSSTTYITAGTAGSGFWTAANGDRIDTTMVGSGEHVDVAPCQAVGAEPEDGYFRATQIHTINGGTGRFAGVQGSFTVTLYHDLVERNGTHATCGSYSGTITPPGAAH